MTTVSQDVQTRFSVLLAFAKFLSKIKGNFQYSASIMDTALPQNFFFILDRNLAKANCTGNRVCTFCDTVILSVQLFTSWEFCPLLRFFKYYCNEQGISGIRREIQSFEGYSLLKNVQGLKKLIVIRFCRPLSK